MTSKPSKQSDIMQFLLYLTYKFSTFKLPPRDPIWKIVQDFGFPDWTVPSLSLPSAPSIFTDVISSVRLPMPILPQLQIFKTPLQLKSLSLPFKKAHKKTWTYEERRKASKAEVAENEFHLQDLVCSCSNFF
jgi:hypothetical protein